MDPIAEIGLGQRGKGEDLFRCMEVTFAVLEGGGLAVAPADGVAVGGTGVAVGGTGVAVGGSGVTVGNGVGAGDRSQAAMKAKTTRNTIMR